jgi:hypothetical protein
LVCSFKGAVSGVIPGGLLARLAGYGCGLSYTSAALPPRAGATTLTFGPVQPLATPGNPPASETSFAVFNNQLYCAYRDAQHYVQVMTLAANGGILTPSVASNMTFDCGALESQFGVALVPDPKGTFLAMVFSQNGSDQLCSSYIVPNSNQWTDPQLVGGHTTNATPSLITTGGDLGYLAYIRDDGNGINLTASSWLPLITP